MSPFEITLAISILVLGGYAVTGLVNFGRSRSYESFFLFDRNLSPENVRNTFTGAAISISTVLIFFLTLSPVFGWYIFLSPLTLALGVFLFGNVVYPRLQRRRGLMSALKGEASPSIDSLGDLIQFLYGAPWLSRTITAISGFGIVCVLVAELMVGVTIYQQYFLRPEYIVFLIAGTLFVYAGFGGLRSVVQTDRWQVRLIVISVALIVLALAIQESADGDARSRSMWTHSWRPVAAMPLALILNMLFVNLCFLPSSLRVWQVVAGSAKGTKFRRALWLSTAQVTFILTCAVFVGRGVAVRNPGSPVDLQGIFAFLANNESPLVSYAVYPLFVAALLSALVSTADSAILPLAQVMSAKQAKWRSKVVLRNVFGLLAAVIAFYFLVTKALEFELVPWILTVLSVTTCIAPAIVVPILVPKKRFSRRATLVVGGGVIAGCATALAWSVAYREIAVTPWNCIIGVGISLLCCLVACAMPEDAVDNKPRSEA